MFKPTLQYLKAEQFDAARTNTNYITRFLNIKKSIDALLVKASDYVDDPDVVSPLRAADQVRSSVPPSTDPWPSLSSPKTRRPLFSHPISGGS